VQKRHKGSLHGAASIKRSMVSLRSILRICGKVEKGELGQFSKLIIYQINLLSLYFAIGVRN
jgi:hypothetical protein